MDATKIDTATSTTKGEPAAKASATKYGADGKILTANNSKPATMSAKPSTAAASGTGMSKVPTAFTYTGALGPDGKPVPGTQKMMLHYTDAKPGGGAGVGRY